MCMREREAHLFISWFVLISDFEQQLLKSEKETFSCPLLSYSFFFFGPNPSSFCSIAQIVILFWQKDLLEMKP